jgi:hypothetical protein
MNKLNLDVFKILLLIILVWIAHSLYNYSSNGRYQFDNTDYRLIIDTRTGKTYEINYDDGKSVELTKEIE